MDRYLHLKMGLPPVLKAGSSGTLNSQTTDFKIYTVCLNFDCLLSSNFDWEIRGLFKSRLIKSIGSELRAILFE